MGRQTYLPEDSEYNISLHDFMPHVVQGTQGNQELPTILFISNI